MATIIEFEVPAKAFALEETLVALPDIEIEIERVVAGNSEHITPYVWAHADDFDALEAAFEADPTVESASLLSETKQERSYQITWAGSIEEIVQLLTDHQGTLIHATGSDDGWHLRTVFPDRKALSEACDAADEIGLQSTVQAIYESKETRHIHYGLTEKQRETMVAAFEAGCFSIPREVTLTEFAEQRDISHQSISERIRRATGHLVESTLISQSEEGT